MPDLYADQDVSREIVTHLRRGGLDVIMTREVQRQRNADPEQLAFATAQQRILLTRNRDDFVLLHDAWLHWSSLWNITPIPQHTGILVVPHGFRNEDIAADVAAFMQRERTFVNDLFILNGPRTWLPRSAYLRPTRRS